jgi:hypothetical protein
MLKILAGIFVVAFVGALVYEIINSSFESYELIENQS